MRKAAIIGIIVAIGAGAYIYKKDKPKPAAPAQASAPAAPAEPPAAPAPGSIAADLHAPIDAAKAAAALSAVPTNANVDETGAGKMSTSGTTVVGAQPVK